MMTNLTHPVTFLTGLYKSKLDSLCFTMVKATIPHLAIAYAAGTWNTILFIVWWLLNAALYVDPIERQQLNDSAKRYVPRSERWTYCQQMKNCIFQGLTTLGTRMVSNIDTSLETKRKLRQKSKYYHAKHVAQQMARQRERPPKPPNWSNGRRLMALVAYTTVVAMPTEHNNPHHAHNFAKFDSDSFPIGVDNRCSGCISSHIEDFIGPLDDVNRVIKGFGGTTHRGTIKMGTIKWSWCDDDGFTHTFLIPGSYYVPDAKCRLLSPQHWAKRQNDKSHQGTGEFTGPNNCTLYWDNRKHQLTIPLSPITNLATLTSAPGYKHHKLYCELANMPQRDEDDPLMDVEAPTLASSLSKESYQSIGKGSETARPWPHDTEPSQVPASCDFDLNGPAPSSTPKEVPKTVPGANHFQEPTMSPDSISLLKLHQKFNHISFRKLQLMAKLGVVDKKLAKCEIPFCSSCMYAKQTRTPWRNKPQKDYMPSSPPDPGEVVSVDHMVSPTQGFIAQMTGILTTKRYKYATVFVDQGSGYGYVHLQQTASAEETIKGKIAFELQARSMGITVKAYHADNGVFRAKKWVDHCASMQQGLSFAGVNAHHQNGKAERRIRELQELARTMLIHASKRWPKCITANLWPYAIRMANHVYNHTPSLQDKAFRSPQQIFSKSTIAANAKHFHPFGCPVFVLDNALQHGGPFHKWNQRSRVGIYLGPSPAHGRNIGLILDRNTGLVSPQFHVKYDPSFHSVMQDNYDSKWQQKAGFIKNKNQTDEVATISATAPDIPTQEVNQALGPIMPSSEGAKEATATASMPSSEGAKLSHTNQDKRALDTLQHQTTNTRKRSKTSDESRQVNVQQDTNLKTITWSKELTTLIGSEVIKQPTDQAHKSQQLIAMATEISQLTKGDIEGELFCLEACFPDYKADYHNLKMQDDPLYAYKASADPDTMYMHQALKQPDAEHFKAAMEKEVKDQMENGNFTIELKSSVPKGTIILPAVWQMKRKRDIRTQEVKKYKARLNIDGSRMKEGVHYDETYAPVASWKSIRLLLTLVARHGWHSRQLDYVLAFPQAPVEKTLYMQIPKGIKLSNVPEGEEYVLKLHRNVYGQPQSGRVWNKYLTEKLIKNLGFKQSKVDECVFFRGKTMYVLYTDDSLLAGPDQKEIDTIIKDLEKAKLAITDEGDIKDFLGVNIEVKGDEVHLTQPHLIDKILEDLNFGKDANGKWNAKPKETPALSSKLLSRDSDGPEFDESFHYRSIIGKLNYLEKGTRSDIAYIVHQCARFSESPKESHAKAIRWLGRYLSATRDKGLILRPQPNRGLEVYVDADFSGNWDPKSPEKDRDTARSRHGYIIMYEGAPILWKSQLQTEIALSSTESEYIGISYALREVIPLMELLREMKKLKFPILSEVPKIHCKLFEDNSGALEMAKTHKYRPRTKHLNVKLHHFRDYVERKEISIHKIDTLEQLADYLTKPVSVDILQHLRPKVMGW